MSTDDSGEGTETLKMNKDGLRRFLEDEVDAVRKAIDSIRNGKARSDDSDPGPDSMAVLAGQKSLDDSTMADRQRPLALGLMVSGKGPGAEVNSNIKTVAGAVDGILEEQSALFRQIIKNLEMTIEELLKEQGASLEEIDGQDMLDIFADVETELTKDYDVSGSSD